MKYLIIIFLFFGTSNCSLNSDSNYWTENSSKDKHSKKKLKLIKVKSKDITSMTMEEYELYLKDHTKNSDYPYLN